MNKDLYHKLLLAPDNAPVFLSDNLDPDFILQAYPLGLFPWSNKPVSWWCPNPRCVLNPNEIHIQKNIKKYLKTYEIRLDFDFLSLIKLCKNARSKSWIDDDFIKIYNELFLAGYAHSLELYDEAGELVGGIYGLVIGKVFFGESMVGIRKNVSKIALIKLCEYLKEYDFLIDCQVYNSHLEFMGARQVARSDFLKILSKKCEQDSGFSNFKNLISKK